MRRAGLGGDLMVSMPDRASETAYGVVSQFAADFVKNLRGHMGGDARVPETGIQNYGYMNHADTEEFAGALRNAQTAQLASGVEARLLTAKEIAAEYPFYAAGNIVLGSINTVDEGYWDGGAVFDWFRRSARERGVEYVQGKVVATTTPSAGDRITRVMLASGETIACGQVVNATGPRAARTAAMAGIELRLEPRKRFTGIFKSERPLDQDLPLTIDTSGVHVRQDGRTPTLPRASLTRSRPSIRRISRWIMASGRPMSG